MLRISKIVDYGILVLTHMAAQSAHVCSAAELAASLGLGQPVVSKVLKLLAQHGLVASTRGAHGGYRLGREAGQISVAEIIDALEEQPFGLTECTATPGVCSVEGACHIRTHWQRINLIVRRTLEAVTVADMLEESLPAPVSVAASARHVPAAASRIPNIPNWSLSK
ncbi:SUF system Fe-S cluster assembly regulator [Castellaniella caeni]|uniref:SUF system Fe-S cluster assembly regulator n=1 Tax=Castellaniella caeni TaxID=266123 RepID=UPI0009FEA6FB|nr:SUF system Fe-S cluster assembly regulator [Castellaniella caeni]